MFNFPKKYYNLPSKEKEKKGEVTQVISDSLRPYGL